MRCLLLPIMALDNTSSHLREAHVSQEVLLASSLILIATLLGGAFDWLKSRDTERERTKRLTAVLSKVPVGAVFAAKSGDDEVTVIGPCQVECKSEPVSRPTEAEPKSPPAPSSPSALPASRPRCRARRAERPE